MVGTGHLYLSYGPTALRTLKTVITLWGKTQEIMQISGIQNDFIFCFSYDIGYESPLNLHQTLYLNATKIVSAIRAEQEACWASHKWSFEGLSLIAVIMAICGRP